MRWLITALYYSDIQVLKTYGAAPYASQLKKMEKDIKEVQQKVNEKIGMGPRL
jgi:26S proteasome regulatory subunit T1